MLTEWRDLDCFEKAILCNLWRQAPGTGRKPANIPLRALLRGLDPAIRDSALVKEAVRGLIKIRVSGMVQEEEGENPNHNPRWAAAGPGALP